MAWLRPLLVALAHARGEGMPIETASRAAQAFAPDVPSSSSSPSPEEVAQAMRAARFYLRRSADVDGTTLYRLFHQGLADHLSAGSDPFPLMVAMLSHIDVAGSPSRRWDLAEPYLRRHVVQHCDHVSRLFYDLEFFVYADPAAVLALLAEATLSWLDTESYQTITGTVVARRYALALSALRAGQRMVADDLSASLPWRPLWMVTPGGRDEPNTALRVSERPTSAGYAKVGSTGYLFTWESHSHFSAWEFGRDGGGRLWTVALPEAVASVEVIGGAVVARRPDGAGRYMSLRLGTPGGALPDAGATSVSLVEGGRSRWIATEQGPILVAADEISGIRLFKEAPGGTRIAHGLIPTEGQVTALDCVAEAGTLTVTALCGEQVVVHAWLLRKHAPGGRIVLGRARGASRIGCFRVGGKLLVVTSGAQVLAWIWPAPPSTVDKDSLAITAVACDAGRYAATATADGALSVHNVDNGARLASFKVPSGPVTALAFATATGRRLLLAGTRSGDLFAWDIERDRQAALQRAIHGGPVTGLAVCELGGGTILLSAGEDGVRLTDLATNTPMTGETAIPLPSPSDQDLPRRLRLDDDGTTIIVADPQTGHAIDTVPLGAPIESFAATTTGDILAIVAGDAVFLRRA